MTPLSLAALALASCGSASTGDKASAAETVVAGDPGLTIAEVAQFDEPWAMAFLPGTPFALITERKGKLMLWQEGGEVREVDGVPAVDYGGQGGLGEVALATARGEMEVEGVAHWIRRIFEP